MRDKIKLDIQRFANISNSENDTVITGTADADSINNDGSNVTINALEGADTIENYGSNVIIDAGAGNDTIFDGSNDVSINAGVGDNYVVVSGGTVVAEGGNDIITGMNVSNINAGDGNNYVSVAGSNDLIITAGSGKDTIANYGYSSNVMINSGAGNDSVYNEGENVWIKSDSGDDSISNYGSNVTIESGDGDDYINAGSSVTINTGEGNNTVLSGSMAFVNTGSGNNIVNFSDDVTVNSGGNTRVYKEGGDTLELGADGSATLGYEVNAVNSLAAGGSWSVVGTYRQVKVGEQSVYFENTGYEGLAGIITADSVDGAKINTIETLSGNVTVESKSIAGLQVDRNTWTISGALDDTVNFDSTGTLATITANADSELTIAATSNSSVNVQHDNQTLKANINGVKVFTSENYNGWLNLQLDNSGLAGISGPYGEATIEGDNSFKVNDSFEIENIAGTTTKFSVSGSLITIRSVKDGDNYNVNGGDRTVYELAENDSAAQVSLNGEGITISSASSDVQIVSAEGDAIASITGAYLNDKIRTTNDKAFWVTYDTSKIDTASDDTYSIQINDAVISMKSSAVDTEELSVYVDNSSSIPHVSIYSGSIANGSTLSVGSGIYNVGWSEAVTVNESTGYLYLDSNGNVTAEDSSVAQIRIEREQAIAALVSSLNGGNTTVQAFKDFYNLYDNFPSTFTSTVAGYENGSVTSPSTTATSTGVNIYGDNSLGANPEQITLQSHLSDPINIEHIEGLTDGQTVRTAVIDASGSKNTLIALGMNEDEDRFATNHTILGSDEQSTILVGPQATGNHSIKAGNGGDFIYHNAGGNGGIASIFGGSGSDSIFASNYDYVEGGSGADYFYDGNFSSSYNGYGYIQIGDYNADEGDVIIVTKLAPGQALNADNVSFTGDAIAIAGGNYIQFGYGLGISRAVIADSSGGNKTNVLLGDNIDASTLTSGAMIFSSYSTVRGSTSNDTIYNGYYNNLFRYYKGDGNDTIYNFGEDDTLEVVGTTFSTVISGNDFIVNAGGGSVRLVNAATIAPIIGGTLEGGGTISLNADNSVNNTVITGTAYADSIVNSGANVTISGLGRKDTISNTGNNVSILGGADDDKIVNAGLGNVTINNGIYLDRVTAKGGANVTIEGGAGQDTITNSGSNVTINGGADRDTIYNTGSGNVYQYSAGNDVIVGVTANDTLIVNDTYSTVKNGNDLIVMTADNKVTFKDAANIVPHIVGTPASTVTEGITVNNSVGNTLISGTAGNDSIVNTGYNVTINTGLGNDTVINSSYNSTINGANINYVGNFSGSHDVDLNGQRLSFYAYYNGGLPRSVSVVSHSYDPIVSVTGLKLNDNFSSYTNIDVDYPVGEKNYQVTFDTSNATAPSDIYTMQVGGRNISLAGSAVDTSKPITVNIDAFGLTTISGGIANNSTWTVYGGGVYKIGDSDEITLNAGYGYIYIDGNGKATGEEEIVVSVRKSREESIHSLASAVGSTSPDEAVIDASNTSVVACGMDTTQAAFSTNHTILGGDKQSTIMVGSQAKGDIYVKAGNGGSYLYHNGDGNTSLIGGTGADTFSASTGDYVEGKGGADYFLDTENYQIADYNADEGDIIMATRLSPYAVRYAVLNPDIIQVDGNKISVADGATLTLGSDYDGGATKAIVTDCIGSNRINLIWAGNSASVIDAEDFDRSNIIITSNNGNTADTIIGSAFVDTIYSGSGDYINSGAGRDIISLSTGHSGVSIELTQGMDTVYNFNVADDTILALESNGIPTLKTRNNDLIVYSGEASLQIVDGASLTPIIQMTPTIISGYGNNTVDNTVINGTEHRDHISNSGSNVTINAYGENDTIRNSGADVLINADTGNDEVNNSGSNVTINGGEGNDRLYNIDGSNVVINGNEGNNTILNYSTSGNSNVTITSGAGNDSIYNEGSSNVTINGSTGDDTITNKSSYVVYQYVEGDGNDIIEGFTTSDTLVISSAVNETAISGDDFVVKIGEGSIILTGAATLKPNIVAPIENIADNTILTGTAYDDTITNSGSNVTINALAGNDTITNTGSSVVYQYSAGDGNDVIVGFTDSDTLIISSDTYRTSISGKDLIVTVVGSENFITLKDAANLTPIIIGAKYSGYRDKDGKEIENPVAMIASGGVTYYYESVARATNDADNNSTVTVTADSTETAQINATRGLTIQFAESGLGVYSVSGGNFVSADTSQAAQFSISSNRVLSNSNSLLINNGSTATVDGYAVTGTSNGYTFALQDNSFTLNNISYSGTGTANFNTSGNVSVTSGAIITGNNEITSSTGIGLSEGNYTINGVEFSVASNNTAQTTADGVKFNLSSDTVTYNSMTFSGAGTATIQSDTGIYLTGSAVVSNVTAGQAFTFNGTGTFKLNDKTIVSSATSLTVMNTDNGLTIGENTFSVTSDEEFTLNVDASGKIVSASNINGGSTIVNAGGADSILTSSAGNFTFAQDNNKVFNIAGDDSVTFGLSSDGTVTKIADVIGTISGDFTNAININGNAADIWIGGDNSVSVTAENKGASEIRGVSNNATIQGTGGASTVTTDEEGSFNFYDSQHVTVSGDSSVDFILRDSIVTGVANFENGTYFLDNTAQISVNADSLTLGFTDTATLVIADSQVVSVDGIEGYINGLTSDATVHAVGAMTVNGSNVNVSGDNDFNVIVSDGKTSGLTNISSGASVSVAGMNVTTDNNGDFKVGEYVYSINNSDGSVTFITNSTGFVENIIGLNGTLKTTARNITINGGTFTTTNTDVTISSAGAHITRVNGLNSGDTIGGNLNSSTVIMPAATDTDTSVLTINERSYSLSNDSDGVSLTGNRVDGLNSGASLTVDAAGSYLVNNTALDARIGDIFIGTSEGAAYIYDPNNVPLDITNMTDEEIAAQAGVSTNYNVSETDTEKTAALLESSANLNGSMELALSNSDTTNAQTADFSNSTGVKKVTLKEGAQEIKFNDEGGNVAIIESSSAGEKNVSLGGGGDLVIVKETETPVNITAGSGKDTIVTAGNNVKVGMKGGATKIVPNSGNVEVTNYDASTGAGIQIDEFSDIRRAVANDNISLNNGSISFGTSTVVVNNTESESTTVNLYDNKGRKQKVAYTHNDGGKVDASGERENLLLVGNKNMDKGNANLVSGRGNDSALGGAGDYFDLGAGNNYVSINSNRSNATEGATVAVTAKEGKTEVDGFRSGFAETADKVMFDLTNAQVSFKNGKLTFDIGSASLVLNFMGNSPDLAESADLISDNNFICDTTLDDITPMTFEQGESQNWYDTTFTTASDTLSSGSEITFACV